MPLPAGFGKSWTVSMSYERSTGAKSISDIGIRCVENAIGVGVDTVTCRVISEVQYRPSSVLVTEKEVLAKPVHSTVP